MSIIKGTNQIVAGFGGTKENIGDVKWSYSKLATDNSGRLPLFTGETIASANTIYPEFYNWVLAHTELQCTSAEYEASLTTYGECAKYVIGGGSLRLPLIKNYIKAANTSEGIKNIEAGLPNITGGIRNSHVRNNVGSANCGYGAVEVGPNRNAFTGNMSESTGSASWDFDASRSSSIYGKSSTVTPVSTTLYPWVVAYAAAVPASTAQAAEFQQGLSGKSDTNLGNTIPSQTFKEMSVGWGMPDYNAGISQVEDVEYTAPRAGILYINAQDYNTNTYITIDGERMLLQSISSNNASSSVATYLIDKGTTYKVEFGRVFTGQYITFYPCKGVN